MHRFASRIILPSNTPAIMNNLKQVDGQKSIDAVMKFDDYMKRASSETPEFFAKIAQALSIVEEAFRIYRWEEVCVAFNGGKDCTALLHLVYVVACKKYPEFPASRKLKALYLRPKSPFEEMESFIEEGRTRYNLDLEAWDGNVKEALKQFTDANRTIRAVFMGTRASDPNSHQLDAWAKTDAGWPELMRISPLIKWTYGETWKFIRALCIPYCSLYDQGYTSIGGKDNTERNPVLRYVDSEGVVKYKSAYVLENESLERNGRNVNGV